MHGALSQGRQPRAHPPTTEWSKRMNMRLSMSKDELCKLVKDHFKTDLGAVQDVSIRPGSEGEFCTITVGANPKALPTQ